MGTAAEPEAAPQGERTEAAGLFRGFLQNAQLSRESGERTDDWDIVDVIYFVYND